MPYIEQVPIREAKGLLKKLFDEALQRSGRVWHIVQIMSQNPRAMDASMGISPTSEELEHEKTGVEGRAAESADAPSP